MNVLFGRMLERLLRWLAGWLAAWHEIHSKNPIISVVMCIAWAFYILYLYLFDSLSLHLSLSRGIISNMAGACVSDRFSCSLQAYVWL